MAYPASSYYGSLAGSISSPVSSYEYVYSPTFLQGPFSPVSSEDSWRKSYTSQYTLEHQLSPPPPPLAPLRAAYTSPKAGLRDASSPIPTAGSHYYSPPQQTSREVSFPPIPAPIYSPPKRYGSPVPHDITTPPHLQGITSARNYPPPADSFEIAFPPGAHVTVPNNIPSQQVPRPAIISPSPSIRNPHSSLTELNTLWNAAQGAIPMAGDGMRFVMGVFRPSQGRYVVGPRVEAPFYSFATMQVAEHIEVEVERCNPSSQDRRFVARMRMELEDEQEVMTEIRPANAVVGGAGRGGWEVKYAAWRGGYDVKGPPGTDVAGITVVVNGVVGLGDAGRGVVRILNAAGSIMAELDLGSGVVMVDSGAMGSLPGRGFVDVAVCALFAVALVEERRSFVGGRGVRGGELWGDVWESLGVDSAGPSERGDEGETETGRGCTVRGVLRTVWFGLYFAVRLPWEIAKAIIEAFKPMERDPEKGWVYSRAP